MSLTVSRGIVGGAVKAVCYGIEGVGKTTFAADWPNPVFIDCEGGTRRYDVARMPDPRNWTMLLAEVMDAAANPQDVGTLVIDTADAAEALAKAHVLERDQKGGIEDYGYGKGYTVLAEEFSKLLAALDKCIAAGVNVLVLAHCQIKKFEQPDEAGAYDRYELKLEKKCAPLLKEWSDLLLFANFKTDVMRDEKAKKARATGGTKRVMYAQRRAAWDAKNRFGLDSCLPFEFSAIAGRLFAEGGVVEKPGKAEKRPAAADSARKAPEPAKAAENGAAPEKTADAAKPEGTRAAEPQAESAKAAPIIEGAKVSEVTPKNVRKLRALMERDGVSDAMLAAAVADNPKNKYTESDRIRDYSPKFVDSMVAHWDSVAKKAREHDPYSQDYIPF